MAAAEWPEVLHYHGVRAIGKGHFREWCRAGPHVCFWLVVGGFPCQGLTGRNANCLSLDGERAQLYKYLDEIRDGIAGEAPEATVWARRANVASMETAMIDFFSGELKCRPVRVCPSGATHARRPRLYWLEWPITSQEEVERAAGKY